MKTKRYSLNWLCVLAFGVGVTGYGAPAVAQPAATAAPAGVNWCSRRCDSVVTDFSLAAYHVIKAANGYQDPMAASRSLAMMHVAMHDAINAVEPRYRRYALGTAPPGASSADPAVAAAVAAHEVLVALYPQPKASELARAELERVLSEAGVGPAIEAAARVGKAAAAATLAKRQNDGSAGKERYTEGTRPGQYRYTPPFDFAAAPHWRKVKPFALTSAAQFRSPPAPLLSSAEYTRAFDEVRRVGGKNAGSARSADETNYAAFWYEFSDIGWNRIARVAAQQVEQDLWERARTFALLNMALADSYIAGWDSKYLYDFWRPVTAIKLAAGDGNPHTQADPSFETLLPTPPVPDMPSTHSVLGMAAAVVLAKSFGRDEITFSFASPTALAENPVRSFRGFRQAALENADSRVRAGLHFRFATVAGLQMGERIGEHVMRTALQPEPARRTASISRR